jgi:hypothetical protein
MEQPRALKARLQLSQFAIFPLFGETAPNQSMNPAFSALILLLVHPGGAAPGWN